MPKSTKSPSRTKSSDASDASGAAKILGGQPENDADARAAGLSSATSAQTAPHANPKRSTQQGSAPGPEIGRKKRT